MLLLSAASAIFANNIKSVHGKFEYHLNDDKEITFKQAKINCIEAAQVEAIKAAFGEYVTNIFISREREDGNTSQTEYTMETEVRAKGVWLGHEREPVVNVVWNNGEFIYSVEVWGKAREINQAITSLDWSTQTDRKELRTDVDEFISGERIYVNFTAPADGYVAIYLLQEDDDASCLLPYPNDTSGQFRVKGGITYTFFDKKDNPNAPNYKLTTTQPDEFNEIFLIYSPNSFLKCSDKASDEFTPNSLKKANFRNWLWKCQRDDTEMVVNRKSIKIKRN